MQPKLNLKLELELELEIKLKPKPKLNISCRIYGQRAPLCVCVRGCVCLPFLFLAVFSFPLLCVRLFFAALLAGLNVDLLFPKLFLNSLASSFAAHVCVRGV